MATTYLTDTQGTPTNNIKWTWSSWIKRGAVNSGAVENIFTTYVDASNYFYIRFEDTDCIYIRNVASVGTGGKLTTNRKFRDPGAWYHIVFVFVRYGNEPVRTNFVGIHRHILIQKR